MPDRASAALHRRDPFASGLRFLNEQDRGDARMPGKGKQD
jgi:hypothetical protein